MSLSQSKRTIWIVVGFVAIAVPVVLMYTFVYVSPSKSASFHRVKWGAYIDDFVDMNLVAQDGDLKFYKKKSPDSIIEYSGLDDPIYGFHKDQLYNVTFYISSDSVYESVRHMLLTQYGNPIYGSMTEKKYFWQDDVISLLLTYDETSHDGRVSCFFRPIEDRIEIEKGMNVKSDSS